MTGFRPDLSWLSRGAPRPGPGARRRPGQLAPLIDPNVHSCGTVYPHGAAELAQPEPGLFLVGMKSYGRAPSFLALTGFEQTRCVVAAIAGDHEAAARVELVLPETGVCGGSGDFDGDTCGARTQESRRPSSQGWCSRFGGCCGTPSASADGGLLTIERAPSAWSRSCVVSWPPVGLLQPPQPGRQVLAQCRTEVTGCGVGCRAYSAAEYSVTLL